MACLVGTVTSRILAIGTAVPPAALSQEAARDFFAAQPGMDRMAQRRVHGAFGAAGIDRRHTVLGDLAGSATADPDAVFVGADGSLLSPTTAVRNALYERFAPPLYAEAARAALDGAEVEASAVTHVVTVSCTGFFAPGPDFRLVRDLRLAEHVERYHLGFIGCAAGLPALRLAARITAAQPEAVVLVVSAELCSLHVRAVDDPQQIVAASVFADGAAAAVVTAAPAFRDAPGLDLERFGTALTGEGESDMVWTIGDHGFEMTLSAEVPRIIGREIRGAVHGFLGDDPVPDVWAVHPGGRSILDRVETGLELPDGALAASRAVLRDHGNMSSATILFILRELMRGESLADGDRIAALAFGPGLTVESALLTARTRRRGRG